MIAWDFLQRSKGCRVNAVRNEVLLSGEYSYVFMYSGESVCDMVVFSDNVPNGAVESYDKVLPCPQLLAVWCSLQEGQQGFVICQDYKTMCSQLAFKKV